MYEDRFKNVDLVCGGPPCQGFSMSNTMSRNMDNPNNMLFEEFVRLVTEIKDINAFTIGRIVYYFPFFCLGLFLKRFYRKIIDNKIISMILLCVFIISYAISIIWINSAGRAINFYVVTLSGSLLTWGIAIWLSQWKMSVFKHFGHYSLQYYLNHLLIMLPIYYIVNLIPVLPILQLLAIWIIATAISFIMLKIQLRFKILRLLCGIN